MRPSVRSVLSLFALVVTGPPGSGKTTVLQALDDALAADRIAHAVVEVEAVAWADPPPSDEQSFRHLGAISRMYREAGHDLLLCGATVTAPAYLRGVLTALAAEERLVVRLDADGATLRRRIVAREPPSWSGLPRLLGAVDELAAASRLLDDIDAGFSTTDASPTAVAAHIRSLRADVLLRAS